MSSRTTSPLWYELKQSRPKLTRPCDKAWHVVNTRSQPEPPQLFRPTIMRHVHRLIVLFIHDCAQLGLVSEGPSKSIGAFPCVLDVPNGEEEYSLFELCSMNTCECDAARIASCPRPLAIKHYISTWLSSILSPLSAD